MLVRGASAGAAVVAVVRLTMPAFVLDVTGWAVIVDAHPPTITPTTVTPIAAAIRDGQRPFRATSTSPTASSSIEGGCRCDSRVRSNRRGGTMTAKAAYAPVNGLRMYYEMHGSGDPLLLLPGAYMTVSLMGDLVPALAGGRRVIAVEPQGHGHTADIDRPITYEQLADDAAALLEYLGIERADVYGYSLGGGVALQLGLRHPASIRKIVMASASFSSDGLYAEVLSGIENITPEMFDQTPWRAAYDEVAPDPAGFATLVEKLKVLDLTPFEWPIDEVAAPTLILIGDSDGTRLEHAVEMFRHLGGGVFGDLAEALPASRLAILPATTHVGMLDRADWIAPMVKAFLDE
jgi:pimeloyl-ACP methyl ester carboxylesterase